MSQGDWITVSSSCTKTSFRMTKLTPGKEYGFRVRAENRFGISEPIYSERMIARYPFGECEQADEHLNSTTGNQCYIM